MPSTTFIALLRGINVGGRNRVSMTELRSACARSGWEDLQTYIQSGNIVFRSSATAARVETELERIIEERFGLSIPVIVRTAAQWDRYVGGNPFPEASRTEPNLVMLGLSKKRPAPGAAKTLAARAAEGESIAVVGDALWIHFSRGVARSKLSPGLLDAAAGSPVTTRNWRTVVKLGELARS
jgi:uncharacterized protein (DUF1697 family)